MRTQFNPDDVKKRVRGAVSDALKRFGQSLRRRTAVDWFTATVATGAAKDYRFGLTSLLAEWKHLSDGDLMFAAKDTLTKVRDVELQTGVALLEWTHAAPDAGRDTAQAVAMVENRMALHLAMRGLQYARDVQQRIDRNWWTLDLLADVGAREPCELSTPDSVILALAEKLSSLDERLHRKLITLSSAARTETLVAMRSLMRPRDFLPWWLDGTLETVAAAQSVGGEKQAAINAVLERDPADEEFLRMLVPAIDGPRATIGQPTDRIDVNGSWRDVYAWNLPAGEGAFPTRIELLAPSPGGRGKALELRVGEPVGATASRRHADGNEAEPEDFSPEYRFLAGRAMLLNGIVFIWFRSGSKGPGRKGTGRKATGGQVTAKVTMAASLPLRGQMQLFDCSTNRVLEPVSPA